VLCRITRPFQVNLNHQFLLFACLYTITHNPFPFNNTYAFVLPLSLLNAHLRSMAFRYRTIEHQPCGQGGPRFCPNHPSFPWQLWACTFEIRDYYALEPVQPHKGRQIRFVLASRPVPASQTSRVFSIRFQQYLLIHISLKIVAL